MRSFDSRFAVAAGLALSLVLLSHSAIAHDHAHEDADGEAEPEATAEPVEETDLDGDEGADRDGEAQDANGADAAADRAESAPADPEDVPVNVRLRQLQQDVQSLKERAWRAKARVGMLQESVLGGGIGARASIVHENDMGSSFRLVRLVYALDGAQIFARSDDNLHEAKRFEILSGPISPGSHTLSVLAVYKGHGRGVFRYLDDYTFTVRSSHTFTAAEGRGTSVTVRGYERGGATTPLEDRPAIDFVVDVADGLDES